MRAERFLAQKRAFDDVLCRKQPQAQKSPDVALEHHLHPAERLEQRAFSADNADLVPHEFAQNLLEIAVILAFQNVVAGLKLAHLPCRSLFAQNLERGAPRENERLEQRVAREPICAMHARVRRLANRIEIVHSQNPAICVSRDSAHAIMKRRRNRNRVVAAIPKSMQCARDIGEALLEEMLAKHRHVQENFGIVFLLIVIDGARNGVARGELAA